MEISYFKSDGDKTVLFRLTLNRPSVVAMLLIALLAPQEMASIELPMASSANDYKRQAQHSSPLVKKRAKIPREKPLDQ